MLYSVLSNHSSHEFNYNSLTSFLITHRRSFKNVKNLLRYAVTNTSGSSKDFPLTISACTRVQKNMRLVFITVVHVEISTDDVNQILTTFPKLPGGEIVTSKYT